MDIGLYGSWFCNVSAVQRDGGALRHVLRCLLCCMVRSSTTTSKLASRARGKSLTLFAKALMMSQERNVQDFSTSL